jgi:hypothetical protein
MNINMLPIDTDYGRDLYEMSNIFLHKVVWLGPHLSPGLSASPIYYYLYYPSLWLSGGNIRGPIYFNILVTALALLVFLYVLFKNNKQRLLLLLTAIVLVTSPLWSNLAFHPGNGFSYAIFLLAGLAMTYFSGSLWIAALLMGAATAMHPASILALPILMGAYLSSKSNWKQILAGAIAYVSPWTPVILFEVITKGFLIRQWLAHPGTGLSISGLHIDNLAILTSQLGLRYLWIMLLPPLGIFFDKKVILWEKLTLVAGLIFFSLISTVPEHYLFGLSMTYLYVVTRWLWQKKVLAMLVLTLWLVSNMFTPPPAALSTTRPLRGIEQSVNEISKMSELENKKLAIVAVLPSGTSVPQADDYRGLLRMRGINAVELSEHSQADLMVYIVEQPVFDYEHWSTWETEQFGTKKMLKTKQLGNTLIVVWERI